MPIEKPKTYTKKFDFVIANNFISIPRMLGGIDSGTIRPDHQAAPVFAAWPELLTRTFISKCPDPKDIRDVTFTESHIQKIASVIFGVMTQFHAQMPDDHKAIYKGFAELFPEVSQLLDSQVAAIAAVKANVLK